MSGKSKHPHSNIIINYLDLLYMTSSEPNAKDIYLLLKDTPGITIELWEEMNVLELELSNHNHVDIELLNNPFQSPADVAFAKNRNIKTIFTINLCDTDLKTIVPLFEKITERYSGFLCADTSDFTPVYVGSATK